ncbi:MAG TPA: MBOAT family protein [Verrucomicrobiales bacterium]|nr:MBOAT family protein [Verrucomicrobiales bacterium]
MLFHTWTFLLFFVVVLTGLSILKKTTLWIPWLLLASYVFYGWWNPFYLLLIVYSTALDYFVVHWMDKCPAKPCSISLGERLKGKGFYNRTHSRTWIATACLTFALATAAVLSPNQLRPLFLGGFILMFLIALASLLESRRTWLWVSMLNNLSLLAFFKYADFFIGNLNATLERFQWTFRVPEAYTLMPFQLDYLLPVGISFYTFQSMSYTIDFYRGHIEKETCFIRFATFVSFFPQLVAGPIERAGNLLPQFKNPPKVTLDDLADGMSLFLVGLFKKVALANYLSFYVERIFSNPADFNSPALLLGTFAFAWQIYFDFSGYTDMARGVARMMGFRLMLNFNNPYLAISLGDFWARWHISLSTWFRDYVYIPLGGNRKGPVRMYFYLFITFVISGLWHGAAWTFIIWGTLHAFGIILTRNLERSEWYRNRMPRFCKQLFVFCFVCFAWIFFRAESVQDAWIIIRSIFTGSWTDPEMPLLMLLLMGGVWTYQHLFESKFRPLLQSGIFKTALATLMIVYLFLFSSGGGEFIYFQF